MSGCFEQTDSSNEISKNPLENVRLWAYQIQEQHIGENIRRLASSHYDLLVIDQTRSLKGEEGYESKKDVFLLKTSSGSRNQKKIVVCYLDVGEAESYRWYWKKDWQVGRPEWIVAQDPDGWDDNYPVKFWREEWKSIIKGYLDRIIEDGYDGAYLDWLEVYSFGPVARAAKSEELNAREELIKFVRDLVKHARSQKPNFIFMAQNGAELGEYPEYVELFDAISQEAIWYDGAGDPDLEEKIGDVTVEGRESEELLDHLKNWQALRKKVFNVEYAKEPLKVERAYRLGKKHDFATYVTPRPLKVLTNTLPPGY